ncbi:DMT family transporter [Clostridium sp. DL1XJH146]
MNIKYLTDKKYVIILALFACILWGTAFPVLKISYVELGIETSDMMAKIVFAGIRFFLASILLFLFSIFIIKKSLKVNKTLIPKLIVLGLFQTTLQYIFFYLGLANTKGSKASIITSLASFIVVLVAHFIYKDDKVSVRKILGLMSGFLGVIAVNWSGDFSFEFKFIGEGFMVVATLFAALGTIMAKYVAKEANAVVITAWQMLIGSLIMLLVGLPNLEGGAIVFTPFGFGLLMYAAFLSATAFALWNSLLKYNKAGEITLYKFMIPVSGTILSLIFLREESMTIGIGLGLILVSLGIIIINLQKTNKSI